MPSSQVLGFLTVTRYICSCSCHRLSYLNICACKPIITHKQIAINSRQRIRPTLTACSVTNVFLFPYTLMVLITNAMLVVQMLVLSQFSPPTRYMAACQVEN